MSGKDGKAGSKRAADLVAKLRSLFVVDTSDPSKGLRLSLPSAPAPAQHPHSHSHQGVPGYGIHLQNGKLIREHRHADSTYSDWAQAIGPAETELERKTGLSRPRSKEPPIDLADLEYAIIDTETTGLSLLRGHRITEIAIVRVNAQGRVLHEYATLVNPGCRISAEITALTNIDNEMVRMAPRFEDIAHDVRALLAGRVFVAHNAPFDWGFVSGELVRTTRKPLYGRKLCTVRLARKVVPEVRSRSLDSLSYYFNVSNDARHRAFGDARATAVIFRRLMDRVRDREVATWQELEYLTLRRSQKKKRTAMPTGIEKI